MVLATKVWGPMGDDPNQRGNSRRWIMTEVENSLRRLQTDHIDLYQIHRPDPDTDIEETLSALSDLIRSGKVRAIGSSTMPASDIVEAQWVAERRGLARFRTEQPPYSILNRGIEAEVLPVVQRYGMGALVWSPLAKGMLTGRIRRDQQTDLRRAARFTNFRDESRIDAVEKLIPLAAEAGLPITHLAIAFAIAHPGVTSAIIGPRTMEQLDDLLAGVDVRLDGRDPRPDRRDRAARHRRRRARRVRLPAPGPAAAEPAPPPGRRARRCGLSEPPPPACAGPRFRQGARSAWRVMWSARSVRHDQGVDFDLTGGPGTEAEMDDAEASRIERVINRELAERFPGGAVLRAVLRQHDDDPAIEPGQLMVRVFIPAPGERAQYEETLAAFAGRAPDAVEDAPPGAVRAAARGQAARVHLR